MKKQKLYKFTIVYSDRLISLAANTVIKNVGDIYLRSHDYPKPNGKRNSIYQHNIISEDNSPAITAAKVYFTNHMWSNSVNENTKLNSTALRGLLNDCSQYEKPGLHSIFKVNTIGLVHNQKTGMMETIDGVAVTNSVSENYLDGAPFEWFVPIKSKNSTTDTPSYKVPGSIKCKWKVEMEKDVLQVGCYKKTYDEWLAWLDSDEEYETKRDTQAFRRIEASIRAHVAYRNTMMGVSDVEDAQPEESDKIIPSPKDIKRKYVMVKNEMVKNVGSENATLYRIMATEDFNGVKTGEIGGFIESYDNLLGNAWVADGAYVFGQAYVADNAVVRNSAKVFGNAAVYGNATVCNNATVYDSAQVYGDAEVTQRAEVLGEAHISGAAIVQGYSEVGGNAIIMDDSRITGEVVIGGDTHISGKSLITTNVKLSVGEYKNVKLT